MSLTIGAVARRAGLGIQTIRFYEREGLIDAPPRTRSGYRSYDTDVVRRLQFIRRAQELGFTLKEIRELIALESDLDADCDQVRVVASAKLSDVEARIADLTRMKAALEDVISSCKGHGPIRECALMDCLQSPGETATTSSTGLKILSTSPGCR